MPLANHRHNPAFAMGVSMIFFLLLSALPVSAEHTHSIGPIDTVVLVVVDDLGSGDLGYTGSGIKTPVIDALISEGTLLEQYVTYARCSSAGWPLMGETLPV